MKVVRSGRVMTINMIIKQMVRDWQQLGSKLDVLKFESLSHRTMRASVM